MVDNRTERGKTAASWSKPTTGDHCHAETATTVDLVLGTAGGDDLAGGGGNTFDCLVGGNGADRMNAGGGNDWCIGGGGVDVFLACENTDGLT